MQILRRMCGAILLDVVCLPAACAGLSRELVATNTSGFCQDAAANFGSRHVWRGLASNEGGAACPHADFSTCLDGNLSRRAKDRAILGDGRMFSFEF